MNATPVRRHDLMGLIMIFMLGIIGSFFMAMLEAVSVTDIGYWWAVIPTLLGGLAQVGVLGAIFEVLGLIASIFGE